MFIAYTTVYCYQWQHVVVRVNMTISFHRGNDECAKKVLPASIGENHPRCIA